MVTFKLIEQSEGQLIYNYYPEGKKAKKPGAFIVDRITDKVSFTELAEDDFETEIPPKEQNVLIEAINQMKQEQGESDFVGLATVPIHIVYYGDHAARKVLNDLHNGKIPKKGSVMWY